MGRPVFASWLKRVRRLWHAYVCNNKACLMAKAKYRHLTQVQRCKIEALLSSGNTQRAIARQLGVAPSTVSREMSRNRVVGDAYVAECAQLMAVNRRHQASIQPRKVTRRHLDDIYDRMIAGDSLDVIAHRPTDPALKLSTAWLYTVIQRAVDAGDDDWTTLLLRKFRKRRGPRPSQAGVHLIPNRVDIAQRPSAVDGRKTFGHWEGDTIVGARHQGAIVTLVERKTRLLACRAVPRKTKTAVADAINQMMARFKDTVNTITFDNGGEFADHARIAAALDCKIYFAKPYHSWQRGSNENLNGELRRVDPKGQPLDDLDPSDLAANAADINARRRKILGYKTAAERFAHEHAVQLE